MKDETKEVIEDVIDCPIYKTMQLFQGKWNMWVLFELSQHETMRFGEIRKAIPGISNTMLTSTLKELDEKNLVKRVQFNEIPPHVEYSSTKSAKELRSIFEAMEVWGKKYAL